jgi:putative phosphoribosyl transferase
MWFKDRADAGVKLARALESYQHDDVVILAIPRGGVPVAVEVAHAIEAPLDILVVRKIASPHQSVYPIGAMSDEGCLVMDPAEKESLDPTWLDAEAERQLAEAQSRRDLYLAGRESVPIGGKTVLIIDDGIATGLTLKAAVLSARERYASQVVVAAPFAPRSVIKELEGVADVVVVVHESDHPEGVYSSSYDDFTPLADEEVIRLLELVGKP